MAASLPRSAGAETVLRIGMTAADIPRTLGQPDQGYEGNRFTGLTLYDSLTMWDLSSADKASGVIPGLSTEWKVNDDDHTKWLFKLRPGVKFHDGSPFNADAVVWNVEKVLKQDAPQFDPSQVGVTATRMPTLVSARKIDDLTVEMTTKVPDSSCQRRRGARLPRAQPAALRQHRRDRRPPLWRGPAPRVPAVARQAVRRVVELAPGYEHPGDPRQPDNTHRH